MNLTNKDVVTLMKQARRQREPWRGPQCPCCRGRDLQMDPEIAHGPIWHAQHMPPDRFDRFTRRALARALKARPRLTPASLRTHKIVVRKYVRKGVNVRVRARDGKRVAIDG